MDAESEHRYQELLKAIRLIHRHVHADGSPAIVSLSEDHRPTVSENSADRRFREMEEANERRHQELLKAIGLLYHHVHGDDGKAIIPLPNIEPVAPTPADD